MNSESRTQNGIIFFPESTNIGDDIQSYAASLLVNNPVYCDRERLDELTNKTDLLCNGWFMESEKNWPPAECVKSLFISFHISTKNLDIMTSAKAISYYKKHQPIGCRDYHTLDVLKKHQVDAYFSGCLTLTLPKYEGTRGEDILFVDVLRTNYTKNYREAIVKNIIPNSYKDKVQFISHISDDLKSLDRESRMQQAKQMLDTYAKAKIVFTSLIHCALPCVALGTPVVFIDFGFNNDRAKRDRFNGIIDLFKIESNLKAPYMDRNLSSKLFRGLRLIHLNKGNINQLSEELFKYSETTEKHHPISSSMKATIKEFYNS
jgi:hypothetical protein